MEDNQKLREKAWEHHKSNQLIEAEKVYTELIRKEGNEKDISNLGALLRMKGRYKEAFQLYRRWWGKCKVTQNLGINAINAGIEAKEINQTKTWLHEALKIYPNDIRLLIAKGKLYNLNGEHQLAIETLKAITQQNPQNINAWLELGKVQGINDEKLNALESFQKAQLIDKTDARVVANIITTQEELGLSGENDSYIYQTTKEIKEIVLVKGAVAFVYLQRNQFYEAEILYKQLCIQTPLEPIYWLNRCACKRELKESNNALEIIKTGIKYNPLNDNLRHAMSQCYAEIGNPKISAKLMEEEIFGRKQMGEKNLFNLQFLGEGYNAIESSLLKNLARKWEGEKIKKGISPIYSDRIEEENNALIRIAYLSADFCNHPVGRYIKPIIEGHNRNKFEIVGIDCGSREDNTRKEIKQMCNSWIDITKMSDLEAAKCIAENRVDVLIELGGYTSRSRIGILCYKPARIQLSYLGYFGPTYLSTIDGWIGDDEIFGSLNEIQRDAHKLIYMKGGYMTYKEEELDIKEIERKIFRFGTFNHSRKLSTKTIKLYAKVLKEIQDAEIVIKSISFVEQKEQDRIVTLLTKEGIKKERIITLDYISNRKNHLDLYSQIDLGLDPTPYGGATTTCEALWMGVPVVSYAGEGMVGRLSSSILKYSDCNEWIATNERQYIQICQQMARKGVRNKEEREKLRKKIVSSKLCDTTRATNELEKIYTELLYI